MYSIHIYKKTHRNNHFYISTMACPPPIFVAKLLWNKVLGGSPVREPRASFEANRKFATKLANAG